MSVASAGAATGPLNAITDVPGVEVGHSTRVNALTGTTALIFRSGALMGYAPSGGAPGDRLSALLTATHQDTQRVVFHGLTLSGGSIYGLDTACGVVKYLREQGLGYGNPPRPYVPGAIIFDLGRGPTNAPPGRSTPTNPDVCSDGYIAASTATSGKPAQGSVGGGTGASAGGLRSGFGTASVQLGNGIVVGAAVVVNSGGGVYNTVDGSCELYALWLEDSDEFKDVRAPTNGCTQGAASLPPLAPGENTTIGVIATNAPLTAGQAQRMAIIAGDGMARAIRPAHGNGDGDTVFGVVVNGDASTVQQSTYVTSNPSVSNIYNAGADAYSRAIMSAVLHADPALSGQTYCERFPTACPSGGLTNGAVAAPPPAAPKQPLRPTAEPSAPAVQPVDGGGLLSIQLVLAALLLAATLAIVYTVATRTGRSFVRRCLVGFGVGLVVAVVAAPALAGGPGAPRPPTGPNNAITDVPGVEVGHSTRPDAATGTTSVVFRTGALVGFASAGGAPETHLVELLTGQHQDSQRVPLHAIVLSGGSVYGLDTVCGTRAYLDSKGLGFGGRAHLAGATIFDLGRGKVDAPPGTGADPCTDGFAAANTAAGGPVAQGNVGAGTGARAGGLVGGLGTASTVLPSGVVVGALAVVNSSGLPYDSYGDCRLYALSLEQDDEFGSTRVPTGGCPGSPAAPFPGVLENQTLVVVATSAPLTSGQTEQLAIVAGDGIAQAIHPAHANADGNAVFGVTLAEEPASVSQAAWVERNELIGIYEAAVDATSRAITHAILSADPALGETYCDRFKTARCPKVKKDKGAVVAMPKSAPLPGAPAAAVVPAGHGLPALPIVLGALLAVLLALAAAAATPPGRSLARRAFLARRLRKAGSSASPA